MFSEYLHAYMHLYLLVFCVYGSVFTLCLFFQYKFLYKITIFKLCFCTTWNFCLGQTALPMSPSLFCVCNHTCLHCSVSCHLSSLFSIMSKTVHFVVAVTFLIVLVQQYSLPQSMVPHISEHLNLKQSCEFGCSLS